MFSANIISREGFIYQITIARSARQAKATYMVYPAAVL